MSDKIKLRVYDTPDGISRLREAIDEADAVIIGAGAGFLIRGQRRRRKNQN